MVSEDAYCSMKSNLPELKRLLEEEHYIRCVTYGERLLSRSHEHIHPIHLVYIHFFLAMSHDIMAREATRARRCFELNRAEKHYLLAITSLNAQISDAIPPPSYVLPASPALSEEGFGKRSRRTSDASQQSFASSATSISDTDHEPTFKRPFHKRTTSFTHSSSYCCPPIQKLPEIPFAPQSALSDLEWVFLADLSCFRGVVRDHLRNIVDLKQDMLPSAVPTAHSHNRTQSTTLAHSRSTSHISAIPIMSHCRTQSTPAIESSKPGSRFANRRMLPYRPRFDPTSVQKLCSEALHELRR
ncbi:unnamed protein product [Periconia digitata]|uniref:Uncharacterized protein n=1 Tax=Periconia digitata TaxID=1303443 RepID=A0A9W4U7I5_9PLEO|nr:unnamed protein product [Periconia digitata]